MDCFSVKGSSASSRSRLEMSVWQNSERISLSSGIPSIIDLADSSAFLKTFSSSDAASAA